MKHLPPTLRENQRYLKIKICNEERKSFDQAVELVRKAVKEFSGEKGLAEASPWLIKRKFNYQAQVAVVRVNREFEQLFRASITLSKSQIITLNSSGTLKSLQS